MAFLGYTTKQSTEILDCLKKNKDKHMTAEEVYDYLRAHGGSVGRTTVYRHLEKLYVNGEVRKFLGGENQSACFQLADGNESCRSHYHLKCTQCGRLFHTECDFLNELSKHILNEHGFTVDGEKTVLYGICGECKEGKGVK